MNPRPCDKKISVLVTFPVDTIQRQDDVLVFNTYSHVGRDIGQRSLVN